MPKPLLSLTDAELEVILNAARSLEPERRSAFLERIAADLAAMPAAERGVGSVGRLVWQLQREH